MALVPISKFPKTLGYECILDGSWTIFLFDIKVYLSEEVGGKPNKCIFFLHRLSY